MKFSIVTISYNQVEFIEKTILSVINQSYKNFEYIIVDAGSTDGSRDIIMKYKNHFKKIIFESDNGPADGLNKGFSFADGDIYYFINSDDVLLQDALMLINKQFNTNNYDIIYANGYIINENDKIMGKIICDELKFNKLLFRAANFSQPSMFFTKYIFIKSGGFNIINKISWDYELLLEMLKLNANIKKIDNYLSCFRLYNTSITGSINNKIQKDADYQRVFQKNYNKNYKKYHLLVRIYYKILNIVNNPKKYQTLIHYKLFNK